MKKITKTLLSFAALLTIGNATAQAPVQTIQDSIFTNTHWTADKQYLLHGYVYVVSGTTLTIDSGVIIKGDKNSKGSLIVERGAKIYAMGSVNHPIVFTSNQPAGQRTYGDWGGLILCGYAPANWTSGVGQVEGGPRSLYGGSNKHDNSGQLSYVRCEFAGIAFSPNNEINGITFCGVGDQTQVDHLQVSYSGDDSYEWFGGTVNTKYLIAYRGWDDDFDTDNSYSGKNQFGVGLRDPFSADQSGSKAWESDSYQSGTKTGLAGDTTGVTKCVFSNYTCIGPLVSPGSTAYDPQFVAGAHIRRGSSISIMNSIIAGWPCGILFDESSSSFGSTVRNLQILGSAGDSLLQLRNNIICGVPTTNTPARKEVFYTIDGARSLTPTNTEGDTITGNPFNPSAGPFNWLNKSINHDGMFPNEQTSVQLSNPFNLAVPNFVPNSTSPISYNSTALPAYVTAHYGGADHFNNGKVYPFNPANPISLDTSNWFANYNSPKFWPNFSSGRLQGGFFTKVNYVGAFPGTHTTSDDWMANWTNFDPVNTDYTAVATGIKINQASENMYLQAFPNPAHESVTINFTMVDNNPAKIQLFDITGKSVAEMDLNDTRVGINSTTFNTTSLEQGVYFIKFTSASINKTSKIVVVK